MRGACKKSFHKILGSSRFLFFDVASDNYALVSNSLHQLTNVTFVSQVDIDFDKEPIGVGKDGKDVYFRDIWPSTEEIAEVSTL